MIYFPPTIPKEERIRRPVRSKMLRLSNPGFSTCGKCNLPWNQTGPHHSVNTSERSGTFAMCQYCWERSTLAEVKLYFTLCYRDQEKDIIGTKYEMGHTLEHLRKCCEADYFAKHPTQQTIYNENGRTYPEIQHKYPNT